MDMAKYRVLFLEEATEHLSEISSALLDLEKEMTNSEAIDLIFRMAHSIKGMAASLDYVPIAEVSHRLEDRMQGIRAAGCVSSPAELALLFRGFESIEAMVRAVRDGQDLVPDPEIAEILSAPVAPVAPVDAANAPERANPQEAKKKLQDLTPVLEPSPSQTH